MQPLKLSSKRPIRATDGNTSALKKRVMKRALIVLAILVIPGAAAFTLQHLEQEKTAERNTLQASVTKLKNENTTLQGKLVKAEKSQAVYQLLTANNASVSIPIERDRAGEILDALQERYVLSDMRVSLSPVQNMQGPLYKNAHVQGISSQASINVQGFSDEFLIRFAENLISVLPGRVKVQSFSLTRAGAQPPQNAAAPTETLPLGPVDAELKFLWMGMKEQPKSAAAPTVKKAPPKPAGAPSP